MSTTAEETAIDIAERRAKVFERVFDHFENCFGPDYTVPGAAGRELVNGVWRRYPRYVFAELVDDHHDRYFVNLAADLVGVKTLATEAVSSGHEPICYFDLDELVGEEPLPLDVVYEGEEWMVHGPEYVPGGKGETTGMWILKKEPDDGRRSTYDWKTVDPALCDVGDWEDERMPRRYDVAEVVVRVVFNTVPTS